MRHGARLLGLSVLPILLAGCALAGDVTPPPGYQATRAALATATAAPPAVPVPPRPPDPEAGAAIYAARCAACHGDTGQGDGPQAAGLPVPPAALADPALAARASPAAWYQVVSQGRLERFMPPFENLSEAERWDVVAYALSLSLGEEGLARGRDLYEGRCAACHGSEGLGAGEAPSLTEPRLLAALSAADLPALLASVHAEAASDLAPLEDAEVLALAGYLRSLAYAPAVARPAPEGDGARIVGRVVNGTPGGEVPAGLEVVLHGFDGQTETLTRSTRTAADGAFAFEDLEVVEGRLYILSVDYKGVRYPSEVGRLAEGETLELPVTVYEPTHDPSSVRVARLHLLFDTVEGGGLRVIELWTFINEGDRSLVGEEGEPALRIPLPPGATELRFDPGLSVSRFVPTEDGFGDLVALRPGETREIIFQFSLPAGSRTFEQQIPYPVDSLILVAPAEGPRLAGESLVEVGLREVGGEQLRQYGHPPLPAGGTLRLQVRSGGGLLGVLSPLALAGLLAVVLAAGVVVWWYRPLLVKGEATPVEPLAGSPELEAVLEALADLDEAYEAGEVDPETYRARRAELKAQALSLLEGRGD